MSKPDYMSQKAYDQRVSAGFKKDPRFSGEWTMVRIRKDFRDYFFLLFLFFILIFVFALEGKEESGNAGI